jgi:hypothetical protein
MERVERAKAGAGRQGSATGTCRRVGRVYLREPAGLSPSSKLQSTSLLFVKEEGGLFLALQAYHSLSPVHR